MNAQRRQGTGRATGRAVAVVGAAALAAMVFVSAEHSRSEATPLGSALGITPVAPRLVQIADAAAIAHHVPSADDVAFARGVAEAAPLEALPYYIAGAARGPGDAGQGRVLVAAALQRDPRLRPVWSWMLTDRLAAKDTPGVTRALIRLAVLSPRSNELWPAIAQLSADPVARKLIKAQIVAGAPWRDRYLTALGSAPVDRSVVFEMLQSVGRHAAAGAAAVPTASDDRRAFLAALVARKDYERAYLAWVQWLPAASQRAVGHVFDGDFTGVAALPPFAWQLTDAAGGASAIDPAAGLSLDYSGTDGAVVAQQMLLLAPGRYRLVTQADFSPVANENGTAPLAWTVSCLPDAKPLGALGVPLEGAMKRAVGEPFQVDAGCDAQMLALKVDGADFAKRLSGKVRLVSIEGVR